MSGGITLCPHCGTRFRIGSEQLEAHQGMVRCGRCRQVFDAQRDYVPDHPEVPVVETVVEQPELQPVQQPVVTEAAADEVVAAEVAATVSAEEPDHYMNIDASGLAVVPEERITVMPDRFAPPRRFSWLWTTAALVLLAALLAQAAYMFRVDLAARLPGLKPALEVYCQLLECTVPLPQKINLIDIESSALEADPIDESHVTLNAMLRNKAGFVQAFPSLELTLNDVQDKPLARRIFHPVDYLPSGESELVGMRPNHELAVKLQLNIASLKPTGYRLALFYPQ